MCYYRLYIFLHCGHSTSSNTPVGFCKDAKDNRAERLDSIDQRTSTTSTTSSMYSKADSMDAEEKETGRSLAAEGQMLPCTEDRIHPLQTRRLERLCAICQHDRDSRLEALGSLNDEIRFEPWRWQFKYHGGSTSVHQDVLSKEATPTSNAVTTGTERGVATTVNSFFTSSSGWVKD